MRNVMLAAILITLTGCSTGGLSADPDFQTACKNEVDGVAGYHCFCMAFPVPEDNSEVSRPIKTHSGWDCPRDMRGTADLPYSDRPYWSHYGSL